MTWIKNIVDKIKNDSFQNNMVKIILLFLVVLLFKMTNDIWFGIFNKITSILGPFFIGFILAFILRPLIVRFEKRNISRKVILSGIFIIILIFLSLIILNLLPTIYSRLSGFINSIISSLNWLYALYLEKGTPSILVQNFLNEAISFLNDAKTWISFTSIIPLILSNIVKIISNVIFTIIISIYMSLGWEKLSEFIDFYANKISDKLPKYLYASGYALSGYIRNLIILMLIKFVEYSFIYYLLGHRDWLIIGLLTSLGLIIPYFGASIANVIGLVTSLTLGFSRTIILLVIIIILSFIDAYVIAPLIHSTNSRIDPLWSLFCIFSGGVLFGPLGVMISIPVYMIIRVIVRVYKYENKNQTNVV